MTARKKPEDKKKPGRKSKYNTETRATINAQVFRLCLLGAIDEQIAEFFEISTTTLDTWKKKYPTFLGAIKRGKMEADANVAAALYHRACGYSHKDTKMFCYEGDIYSEDYIKHYPPDTAACFIWLKNRAGWRDKQEHGIGPTEELLSLLDIVDGTTKGKLPDPSEEQEAEEPMVEAESSLPHND